MINNLILNIKTVIKVLGWVIIIIRIIIKEKYL